MTPSRRLKPRDRRALVIGLVVIAPIAVYRVAVAPWLLRTEELKTSLSAERKLLARELAVVNAAGSRPALLDSLRDDLRGARASLLEGGTSLAASSALSREVARVAGSAGILIQEVEGHEPPPGDAVLRTSSLAVRALGDLEGILRFLHALENAPTLLTIGELSLRTAGVNDGDLEQGQLMSLALIVSGYWIADGAPDEGRVLPAAFPEAP